MNEDVEKFLKEKAIEFSKQGLASTHLIFSSYQEKLVLIQKTNPAATTSHNRWTSLNIIFKNNATFESNIFPIRNLALPYLAFLRKTIIEMLPEHTCYVELFMGAGWVYFGKEPSKWEVVNARISCNKSV